MHRLYHFGVFIGGFRAGPHLGHLKVVEETLKVADYAIVIVGSANMSRNTRIPFTADERIEMWKEATDYNPRILYTKINDYLYDEPKWLAGVQLAVDEVIKQKREFTVMGWTDYPYNIALTGMHKDETSYYLNSFPQWSNSIAVQPESFAGEILSSTGIRNKIFNGQLDYDKENHPNVVKYIHNHMEANPEIWKRLKSDWEYEANYEAIWGKGPHQTVDSLVVQAGHILLIQRGNEYGAGLWALPGGFVNRREKLLNASKRELREETLLKVHSNVLDARLVAKETFDDPWRDNRSHLITTCFKYVLNNEGQDLPKVKGSDDAAHAEWVPISKLYEISAENKWFSDHGQIISKMMGLDL